MKGARKLWIAAFLLLLVVMVGLALFQPDDPLHNGHRLRHWFALALDGKKEGIEAFHALGPEAVPFLIHRLDVEPARLEGLWGRVWTKLPARFKKKFGPPKRTEAIQREAVALLGEIGPPASPAVPKLKSLIESLLLDPKFYPAPQPEPLPFMMPAKTPGTAPVTTLANPPQRLPAPRFFIGSDPRLRTLWPELIKTLGKIGGEDPELIRLLFKANRLQTGNWAAMHAVGEGALKPSIRENLAFLRSCLEQDELTQMAALVSLAMVLEEFPEVVPSIVKLLDHRSPMLRAQAMVCLREAPGPIDSFVPQLVSALRTDDSTIAIAFTRLLIVTRQGADSRRVSDRHQRVWEVASESLTELGGRFESVAPALTEALHDPDTLLQARVARVLGNLGTSAKQALPRLQELAQASEREVRQAAAWALWEIDRQHEPIMAVRIEELQAAEDGKRWAAVEFLGKLGSKARPAIPGLAVSLINDKNWRVRSRSAQALGEIESANETAIAALRSACGDDYVMVREAATNALARIGGVSGQRN